MGYVTANLFKTLYQSEHIHAGYIARAQQVHYEQVINDLQQRSAMQKKGWQGYWCSVAGIGKETKS